MAKQGNPNQGSRFRGAAVKPLNPPDGDPVRDGPKTPSEMCVLVCIGPERRTQLHDNQQCRNLVQDEIIYLEQLYSEYQRSDDPIPEISESASQDPLEVLLKPGQRYGLWKDHENGDMHGLVTIHGAVDDFRTRILLDTGASVSIISLDLARRLQLKLRTHRQIKVSGLGEVTTYINTHARVKITLGWSVVYVLNIWVGNIGEGVDVLLGMNFRHSAGARLCIREDLVKLPDEETVVIMMIIQSGSPCVPRGKYTPMPWYGQSYPQRELVWDGRSKRWVTKVLYSARSWTRLSIFQTKMFGLILGLLLPVSWSTGSSQGNLDSFVLRRRGMKSGNN
ncbi:hypothetical protein PHMEG_00012556 [Phytophthora megakarya]|uniref:Peptidase A2 domain-containing protein n=1 Tax=Phytophthora megakarya TaxID=4795 RepID=A0A225W9Y4_9STRA|nr:hypothetical protein PHMEG_00012556 [Phytophthora megakarya]